MPKHAKALVENAPDAIWGAKAIAAEINRSEQQVYYLVANGLLGDAVVKVSHKLLLGSRSKLRNLTTVLASKT
jgi:hypothetical protein